MVMVVLLAELATVGFFVVFLTYAAMHADRAPAFAVTRKDPVARTLLRSVQIVFVGGYGVFFLATALHALELI